MNEQSVASPASPTINMDMVLSAVRWAMGLVCGFAVGKGWITSDQTTGIIAAALALVPLAWGLYTRTKASKLASAAAIPEVQRIVVTSQATADKSADKVVTSSDVAKGTAPPLTPNSGNTVLY